jgi:hypothetical protein
MRRSFLFAHERGTQVCFTISTKFTNHRPNKGQKNSNLLLFSFSLTIRTRSFLPSCETPNVRPTVPSKLPRAPQNQIVRSPKPDEKRGNHTHMRVTNWVTRSVPWDVRSKRRKQKQKNPKKNFKKRGNAASVECFTGLFSPCWLACQKQNLDCVKQVSMSTTASSHNAPLYSSVLAFSGRPCGVGGDIRVFHPNATGVSSPGYLPIV